MGFNHINMASVVACNLPEEDYPFLAGQFGMCIGSAEYLRLAKYMGLGKLISE